MGQCACGGGGQGATDPDLLEDGSGKKKAGGAKGRGKTSQVKILLLGTGNSGKSTVFKQFQLEYKNGFSEEERQFYKKLMVDSTISTVRKLLQNANDLLFEGEMEFDDENKFDENKGYVILRRNAAANNAELASRESDLSESNSSGRATNLANLAEALTNIPRGDVEGPTALADVRISNLSAMPKPRKSNFSTSKMSETGSTKSARLSSLFGSRDSELANTATVISEEVARYAEVITGLPEGTRLTEKFPVSMKNAQGDTVEETVEVSDMLKAVWNDPLVQRVYAMEGKMPTLEAPLEYYMEHLDRIGAVDFRPTEEDILRARKQTRKAQELQFTMDTSKEFLLIDPGGQRRVRRQWVTYFNYVEIVLFIVGLDGYTQVCLEDGKTNRMRESMQLFKEICESPFFEKTNFIVFLNKEDLFREKIKRVPLNVCFKSYDGPQHDPNACVEYIKKRFKNTFLKLQQQAKEQRKLERRGGGDMATPMVYVYQTCATNREQMEHFLQKTTRHIFLRIAISSVGMAPF